MPLLCQTHWLPSRKPRIPYFTGRYPNTQPISFSSVYGGGAGGERMAQGSRNQPQSFLWRICHLGHLPGLSRSWTTAAGQSAHPARPRVPLWDRHTPESADAPSVPTQGIGVAAAAHCSQGSLPKHCPLPFLCWRNCAVRLWPPSVQ
uniref:Uncharacterized protein n=1 Tax=Mus musculus TaxID=10090 RepID=Q8BRU8_MOUSE|nr:unnamed protein product [Mus musculus]